MTTPDLFAQNYSLSLAVLLCCYLHGTVHTVRNTSVTDCFGNLQFFQVLAQRGVILSLDVVQCRMNHQTDLQVNKISR